MSVMTIVDDKSVTKAQVGIPLAEAPHGVDVAHEARRGRRRLYPMTAFYSAVCLGALAWSLPQAPARAAVGAALGVLFWTYLEYLAHRYVLHGIFPDGEGAWKHFLHRRFDNLHWYHHLRPWDGTHINGTVKDTGLFVALFFALALGSRDVFWVAFVAGLIQAYVFEEWVHHSVHFYNFKNRYFQYIRRHHLYHHSRRGGEIAYGLTSGLWDLICGTRVPAADRAILHRKRGAASPTS